MRKCRSRSVIGEQCGDAMQLGAPGGGVVVRADRVLHERVRHDDKERGYIDGDRDDPNACQVYQPGQPTPAEDPQTDEGGFEKERGQALHRQRGTEHIADEAGELAPVHPELELLHDPGCHPDSEVDQEQLAEKFGEPIPGNVVGDDPCRLHDGDQRRQTYGERYEDEVVDGGDTELPPRHVNDVHLSSPYDWAALLRHSVVDGRGYRHGIVPPMTIRPRITPRSVVRSPEYSPASWRHCGCRTTRRSRRPR